MGALLDISSSTAAGEVGVELAGLNARKLGYLKGFNEALLVLCTSDVPLLLWWVVFVVVLETGEDAIELGADPLLLLWLLLLILLGIDSQIAVRRSDIDWKLGLLLGL